MRSGRTLIFLYMCCSQDGLELLPCELHIGFRRSFRAFCQHICIDPGIDLDLWAASAARLAKCTPGTLTIHDYLFAGSVPPDGFNPIAAAVDLGVFQVLLAVSVRVRCLETSILLLQSFFIELSLFGDHTLDLFLGST